LRPKAESGERFFGRSSKPPPHQLRDLGSAVSSQSGIQGRSLIAITFFTH